MPTGGDVFTRRLLNATEATFVWLQPHLGTRIDTPETLSSHHTQAASVASDHPSLDSHTLLLQRKLKIHTDTTFQLLSTSTWLPAAQCCDPPQLTSAASRPTLRSPKVTRASAWGTVAQGTT